MTTSGESEFIEGPELTLRLQWPWWRTRCQAIAKVEPYDGSDGAHGFHVHLCHRLRFHPGGCRP